MRFFALALAVAACHSSAGPTSPSNKAPEPDFKATIADELGFLPVDSELVFGIDFVQLRGSDLWRKFEPQLREQFGSQLEAFTKACHFDPIQTVERLTFAGNMPAPGRYTGVLVLRGIDAARLIDCIDQHPPKAGKVTKDGGVRVVALTTMADTLAVSAAGPTTLVVEVGAAVSAGTVKHVLASGAPLRSSPAFMGMYGRREQGATLWAMANGKMQVFEQMASLGIRPKAVDGTLTISDRVAATLRTTFDTPDQATTLATELNQMSGMAKNMVDKFEVTSNGQVVTANTIITEAQIRKLLAMAGGMLGP